jgi:acyl-CoA synthetase (AMP-forming)/AMP-acid ligase II
MLPAADSSLSSLPLHSFLHRHAQQQPEKVALIDGMSGETITYAGLYRRVAQIAGWLAARGVVRGDRVACLALNGKAYTEFYLALAWLGAVLVPLNIRHSPQELAFIINDAGARLLFADATLAALAESTLDDCPAVTLKLGTDQPGSGWVPFAELVAADNPLQPLNASVSGESLFMLLYTSGTTGQPKGCMIAQRSWSTYAMHMAACLHMGETDVYLGFLPYFHVAGFGTAITQLILGATLVTVAQADPQLFYRLIGEYRVSIVFLVPGLSTAFIAHPARRVADIHSLKTFISGAGVEKPELIEAVENTLGVNYFGIYGQTEAGGKVTWADARMLREDPATYGHVLPFYDYCLLDEDDREVPPGEVGELCLRGAGVMLGYWNRPEATAETLKGGWQHSGDLFVRQPNGQLKMVDRKKYLIKTGGENVYPLEVEQVLLSHPAVAEAAVIGVADEKWGEAVKAFIVLRPGASAAAGEIAEWVGARIAGYKKPRYVEFIEQLPRNVSGKVLKNQLAARPVSISQLI